jgi:hypothetical protein
VTHPGSLADDRAQILEPGDRYARDRPAPLAERMDAEEWWPRVCPAVELVVPAEQRRHHYGAKFSTSRCAMLASEM